MILKCLVCGHEVRTKGGFRSGTSWRYQVVKRYRKRAAKFRDCSQSKQEKEAWAQVVNWFDSILNMRLVNGKGAIGLPAVIINDCGEVAENGQKREA